MYKLKNHRTIHNQRLVLRPLTFGDLAIGDRFSAFFDGDLRIKCGDTQYKLLYPDRLSSPIDWVIGTDNPDHNLKRLTNEGWVHEIEDEVIEETNEPLRAKHLNSGDLFVFEEDYAKDLPLGNILCLCEGWGLASDTIRFGRMVSGGCFCDPEDLVLRLEEKGGE